MQKLAIIMPAYNEEKRIGATLKAYSDFFNKARGKIKYEILVVINNTTDDTEKVVKKFVIKKNKIRYINIKPGGKGFAILSGFHEALKKEFDLIGFVDADMATSPESFYELIKGINKYDSAIASRALPQSIVNTSLKRKIFSSGFNYCTRIMLMMPYKDTQCGAKIFKRKAVEEIIRYPPFSQWAFDVEVLYNLRKKGFLIKEIPTVWNDKANSTLNLTKVPIQMFFSIARLRLINSPFRFVVRAYDLLPEKIKLHSI